MRFIVLAILGFLATHSLWAEELYYPETHMLMTCDAAVEASFVKNDGDYFWIKIKHVYRLDGHKMKPHDFIRIKQVYQSYAVGPYNFYKYRYARFYLQFRENEWRLYNSSTQGAKRTLTDSLHFDFEFSRVALPAHEFRRSIKEFVKHYAFNPENGKIETELLAGEIEHLKSTNAFILAFTNDYIEEPVYVEEPAAELEHLETPLLPCGILESPPVFAQGAGDSALAVFLTDSVRYPVELLESGITGRVFAQIVIDNQGQIQSTKILRGLGPLFDQEVERLIATMPIWFPAKQRGEVRACEMVLPFAFKLEE